MIDSAAGFICENASALTAARLTWASGSPVDAVERGYGFFQLQKADHADRLHADRGVAVPERFQRRLERVLAPQLLQRAQRAHADERVPVLDQGKNRVGACRVLEFGHAVGRGRCDRLLRIDQQFRQGRGRIRTVEFPERHRHLLTHAGVGIGDHAAEMPDGGRIPGMTERDDRDATLARIGGPEALVGVFEIVVGFERARHDYLKR